MKLTIGELSKKIGLTQRGIRHYEEMGIISPGVRGENNYRYYTKEDIKQYEKILYLKSLGLTLTEIKDYINLQSQMSNNELLTRLKNKLKDLDAEEGNLKGKKENLKTLIKAMDKFNNSKMLSPNERRLIMENLKQEILLKLTEKKVMIKSKHLEYMDREANCITIENKNEFFSAIRDCIEFANQNNLKIGPGRGSAAGSLFLHALGYTKNDPTLGELYPELYLSRNVEIWFDVEYERGQIFIDYCKEKSKTLFPGAIEAFKCPLLDIISNTHKRIGKNIDYDQIDANSDVVLTPFKNADIEKVYGFDAPAEAIIYSYIDAAKTHWLGFKKTNEYLKGQKIINFRDIINLSSLLHRSHNKAEAILNDYAQRKIHYKEYEFLPATIREKLKLNFGMILFNEEIIDIIKYYTNWDILKCKRFRLQLRKCKEDKNEYLEICNNSSKEIIEFLREQAQYTFNKAHSFAESYFIKQTAVLKTLHKKEYFEEISKWEDAHGLSWSEIGYIGKGIILMQN